MEIETVQDLIDALQEYEPWRRISISVNDYGKNIVTGFSSRVRVTELEDMGNSLDGNIWILGERFG